MISFSARRPLAVCAVVLALALAGCAGQQSDYGQRVADQLQSRVLDVSTLASAADYAEAMVSLSELEVDLKDALARGELTDQRYESILSAAALVRTDLRSAIDAQAPDPAEEDDDDGDSGNGKDKKGNSGKD